MSKLHEQLWSASRSCHRRGWGRVARLLKAINFLLHHCLLPAEAEVGEGVCLDHYGLGVVIHPQVSIGDRVRIYHGVTIAGETWIGSPVRVRIGSDVGLGVGCKIIPRAGQGLTIGEGAVIGVNAVVTKDVPAWEVWAGVPARRIGDAREWRRRLGLPIPATAGMSA
jgi:serine acetyltransferase